MDADWLVVPVMSRGAERFVRVIGIDLESRRTSTFARPAESAGMINWAVVADDWLVWVDQDAEQSDAAPQVHWRILARHLPDGATRTLASSRVATPFVPRVQSGNGWVVWGTAESDRSVHQWAWRAGAGAPITLMRHAELTPDKESVMGDQLVYLGPSALPHRGHTIGGDCWSVPLTGGSPTALTRTGLAMDCHASDDLLVYYTHVDPEGGDLPPDGVADDPWQVWAVGSAGGRPMLWHQGYFPGMSPAVGSGFAVWPGGDVPYEIGRVAGGPRRLSLPETVSAVTAYDDRLALLDTAGRARGQLKIRVLQMQRAGDPRE